MIISIALIGVTLVSMAVFYFIYQSNLDTLQVKDDAYYNAKKIKDDATYQAQLDAYNNGQSSTMPYAGLTVDDFVSPFDDQRTKLQSHFRTTAIIHIVIIGFIILAEMGLLLVLPKRTNYHNMDIRNRTE